mgnify:CR=1 FL=1
MTVDINISKKKKAEFDEIFKLIDKENFFIDINLFRNLFESDFYEHFLSYVENKMSETLKTTDMIILHTNIHSLSVQDTYYYNKIILFAKTLHKYTNDIKKIILYGSSTLIINLIKLINVALGTNVSDKIFFSNDNLCELNNFVKYTPNK